MIELLRRVNREGKFRLPKKELAAIAVISGGDETAALRLLEERGAKKIAARRRKRGKGKRTMKRKRKGPKRTRRTNARKSTRRVGRKRRRPCRASKTRKAALQFVGNVTSIVLTRATDSAPKVIRQSGMKLYVPKNGGKTAVIRGLKSNQ